MTKSVQTVLVIFALLLVAGGTASAKSQKPAADTSYKAREISDPIEPVNRFIFGFNDILDHLLIEPLAKGYNAVLPRVVRDGIQNFMRNLRSPLIVANDILQGKIGDAGTDTARFMINSTIGVAGLVDVAGGQGLKYRDEDFGQTMGKWGVGHGFYLVLPVLGPSSLRDGVGTFADAYADPVRIIADNTDHMWIYYTRGAIEGLDERSRLIKAVDDMRRNSIDYYAAVRSAYGQKRAALVRDEDPQSHPENTLNSSDHP